MGNLFTRSCGPGSRVGLEMAIPAVAAKLDTMFIPPHSRGLGAISTQILNVDCSKHGRTITDEKVIK